ncbi:MAG TPA: phosphatase PAP2 family protein [Gemmatimonadales bacterium]|nr:phosphatase PAP2 family protein [Gemmatimonadales bacterium]
MASGESPGAETGREQARLIGLELGIGLVLAILAGILFAWLGDEVAEGDTQALDDSLRALVNQRATSGLTSLMVFASVWGAPRRLAILAAIAVVAFLARRWRRGAILVVVTLLGASLLDGGLKLLWGRQRPTAFFEHYPSPESFSFPSGHALFATAFFGGLAALLYRRLGRTWLRVAVAVAAVLLILLIGFSRIYLGVHYPSDVLGGFAAGTVWVAAVALGDRIASHRRRGRVVAE